jgi:hypothetical protein
VSPESHLQRIFSEAGERELDKKREVLAREAALPPREDALNRAWWNGTWAKLADEIQRVHWIAGYQCDDETANAIAAEKIMGKVKLPPVLKSEHIRTCPRCKRAHLLPLTMNEQSGRDDAVERLCHLAQAVVKQDYGAQRDLVAGDSTDSSKLMKTSNAAEGRAATTGGGRRLPSGVPGDSGRRAAGHQGTGTDYPTVKNARRFATGSRRDNAILAEVADELRDKAARQVAETALTERKRDWMLSRGEYANRDRATEMQQRAAYLVHVVGRSIRGAAEQLRVSKGKIERLLAGYAKKTA